MTNIIVCLTSHNFAPHHETGRLIPSIAYDCEVYACTSPLGSFLNPNGAEIWHDEAEYLRREEEDITKGVYFLTTDGKGAKLLRQENRGDDEGEDYIFSFCEEAEMKDIPGTPQWHMAQRPLKAVPSIQVSSWNSDTRVEFFDATREELLGNLQRVLASGYDGPLSEMNCGIEGPEKTWGYIITQDGAYIRFTSHGLSPCEKTDLPPHHEWLVDICQRRPDEMWKAWRKLSWEGTDKILNSPPPADPAKWEEEVLGPAN